MRRGKQWKRTISLLLCGIMILQTGCTTKESKVVYDAEVSIKCSWWGNDDRHHYMLEGLDQFMHMTDDHIQVISSYGNWGGYENHMRIYMQSHNTPDVMLINYSWIEQYSPQGEGFYNLYDLADVVDLDNYTEDELRFGEVNGKLQAIPISFNTPMFYYNKSLYQAYGLQVPKTWEDLFAAAKVMKKDGVYPLGASEKQAFFLLVAYYVQTTGQEVIGEDGTVRLGKEDIGYILDFYKRLIDEKVLIPIDQFTRNTFSNGTVAGTLAWISDAGNYCNLLQESGNEVAVGEYVCASGAKAFGWYVKPATMYAISGVTEHPKEAGELLNYLLNSEEMTLLQGTEKGIPISDSARNILTREHMLEGYEKQADDMREQNAAQLKVLSPMLENEDVYDVFKVNADYYLYDKLSREEVVEKIYEAYQNIQP